MKKILFRADANPAIGTGDLVSLIHLSRVFDKNGWESHFMVRDSAAAKKILADYKIARCETIADSGSGAEELAAVDRYLTRNRITHLFACITDRPLTEYALIGSPVAKGCVNFDGRIPKSWDLVVNWNFPDPRWYPRKDFPGTRFLLGPEYVILPDNFDAKRVARREHQRPIRKLLVAMGGADALNLTAAVAAKIQKERLPLELTLILGSGYEGRPALDAALKSCTIPYRIKVGVADMFAQYLECDAAIGGGGLTASELVASHTPAILVAVCDHQVARCRHFHEKGWAVFLGAADELDGKPIGPLLQQLAGFDRNNFTARFCGAMEIYNHFSQTPVAEAR
jgi:spore coat polysaccharide biosynthesis predicted glycosyltransferase SpsG